MNASRPQLDARGLAVVLWAIGVLALSLAEAAWRLGARALETLRGGLEPWAWVMLAVVVASFVYGEGVRALQRRFVPHVVARALEGAQRSELWVSVLAPLYAMSLVGHTPRAMARAWAGVALIVLAVFFVRVMPEPWRGIVDAGVACALSWGLGALLLQTARALR